MKTLILLPIAAAALAFSGCDAKVETAPPSNTTVVTPGDGGSDKKTENNTTIVAPSTPAEKSTETNTTVVNPPASSGTETKTDSTTTTTETK